MNLLRKVFYGLHVFLWEILDIVDLARYVSHPRDLALKRTARLVADTVDGDPPDDVKRNFAVEGQLRERPVRLEFEPGYKRCVVQVQSVADSDVHWSLSHTDAPKRGNQWKRDAKRDKVQLAEGVELWGTGPGGMSAADLFAQLPQELRDACIAMVEHTQGFVGYDNGTVTVRPSDEYVYGRMANERIRDDMELAWQVIVAMEQRPGIVATAAR